MCNTNVQNVYFYNNTCDTTSGIHGMWCRGSATASCEFKNNIIYGTGTLYGVFENARLIDGTPDTPGKNNLLYKPGANITGFAGDVKNQDPNFANRGMNNYKLKPESPARDAGAAIPGWEAPTDKVEVSRPQGPYWDIGAYEYNGTFISSPVNLRNIGDNIKN